MHVIFCGTPQFAVPTLLKLLEERVTVELVISNPDEPSGRGYESASPLVKRAAEEAGLKVYQPAKLRDAAVEQFLSTLHPDAIVVVAYGHIIPPWMIALPRLGCINLHASLLPKYRGAAPIQWALIHGERVTGVTTMKIDAGLDTGDILLQREVGIRDDDTTETLSGQLSVIGGKLMVETLRGLGAGAITPRAQNHTEATLAPILRREHGRIDWSWTADEISRRVRGLRPWPGAYSSFRGKNLHIWAAVPWSGAVEPRAEPGTLFVERNKLAVSCGQLTWLEVKELQLEGRKRLSAQEFLNGVRVVVGEKFL